MIRLSGSLFISIALHAVLISAVLFAWKNYSPTQIVQCDTKMPLKLCDIVPSKEHVKPKKTEKTDIKQKKIQTPNKEVEEIVKKEPLEEKKLDTIVKKTEKKENLEPVATKEIELVDTPKQEPVARKIYIEETPKELAIIDEDIKKPEVDKELSEKTEQESQEKKQEDMVDEYLQINTQKIAQLLQDNLYYPRSARKRNITGEVIVKFTLRCDAEVFDIEVIESKSDILSRAAVKTIKNLSGKFPKPLQDITLQVPILYALR